MDAQGKILKTALELFFKYGIRHVTMDDIAKELGMSKKTIYQYYKEKDDLVNQLLEDALKFQEKEFDEITKQSKDPIHEMLLISDKMREMMQNINPMFFLDLQKFYPAGFQRFQRFKDECGYQNLLRNLKNGVEQGLYRPELDVDLIARFRMAQLDMLMFGNYFSYERTSMAATQNEILELFMYGVSSLKGHKLINHYKKIKEVE